MFQPYLREDSEYSGQSEIFVCIYVHSLGKILNTQFLKFIRLDLFLLQDTAGSTAIVQEYPEYSLDSGLGMVQTSTRRGIT